MGRPRKLPPGMHKRGNMYYCRFKAGGRTIRKKLSSDFEAAKVILNDLRARADKAAAIGVIDNDYPWEDIKKEFLDWASQAVRGASEYQRDLEHFEKYAKIVNVKEITHERVIGFRSWRLANGTMRKAKKRKKGQTPAVEKRKPITPRTVNKEVATIRNLLNKAIEWKRIGFNPIAGLKPLRHDTPAKERRSLTVAEVEKLLEVSPSYFLPVLRMFLTTGIRRDELVNMKFADVDFERHIVTVRAETAKNHKAREIPLDDSVLEIIRDLAAKAKHRQLVAGCTAHHTKQQAANFSREHVFVTKANTPWRNNLLTRFRAICKSAGIEGAEPGGSVDLHSLRVSFATIAISNGANPKDIQGILGHSTIALTMGIYTRTSEQGKRAAVSALPFAKASTPEHIVSISETPTGGARVSDQPQTHTRSVVG